MTTVNSGVLIAAALLALLAAALVAWPLWRQRMAGGPGVPVLAVTSGLAIPLLAVLLYSLVSSYPWQTPELPAIQATGPTPQEVNQALSELQQRMEDQPSVEGWALLGQAYLSLQRYPDAVAAWRNAWELGEGQWPEITISYAEALVLNDRDSLLTSAGQLLEIALEQVPDDPRALWYGGLSAAARGETDLATERWSQLLNAPDLPPELRTILQEQLIELGNQPVEPDKRAAQRGMEQVTVTVSISPDLVGQLQGNEVLFVIAREAGRAGPPVAVQRLLAVSLPLTLVLTDADSMLEGSGLSGIEQLELTARLTVNGDAIAQPGDLFGAVRITNATDVNQPIAILINQVQQ